MILLSYCVCLLYQKCFKTEAAMDLFVVPTISFRLLYRLLILWHDRRRLLWLGATTHPTAEWACGWDQAPRYLVRPWALTKVVTAGGDRHRSHLCVTLEGRAPLPWPGLTGLRRIWYATRYVRRATAAESEFRQFVRSALPANSRTAH